MADREDSIHIRIRFDVDEEDRAFTDNLASNLVKTDEAIATGRQSGAKGKTFLQQQEKTGVQGPLIHEELLEKKIKEINKKLKSEKSKDLESLKKQLETKKNSLELKRLRESPVSFVRDMTQEAASNLRKFTSNPGQFFIAGLGKVLTKVGGAASKGGIYAIIALIVYEITLFALNEMMKPGRPLDRRFKRIAKLETMSFYARTLQEELRHGYQEMRVTTIQGLRGGASQVNGNLFEFGSGETGIIQSSPYRSSQEIYRSQSSSGAVTDSRGNPRRRTVFGRFG